MAVSVARALGQRERRKPDRHPPTFTPCSLGVVVDWCRISARSAGSTRMFPRRRTRDRYGTSANRTKHARNTGFVVALSIKMEIVEASVMLAVIVLGGFDVVASVASRIALV